MQWDSDIDAYVYAAKKSGVHWDGFNGRDGFSKYAREASDITNKSSGFIRSLGTPLGAM